jgi:hypothetical protein
MTYHFDSGCCCTMQPFVCSCLLTLWYGAISTFIEFVIGFVR